MTARELELSATYTRATAVSIGGRPESEIVGTS